MVKAQIAQAEPSPKTRRPCATPTTLNRRQALIEKQVVTEAALDQARFAVEGLKASITAGRALLESQKTQLDYLTIRAPITGRTGSLAAKHGAQVRAQEATALVTINQTRPILVSFAIPQGELPAVRRALATKAPAQIAMPGAARIVVPATIAFIDNQVDKQTGAITVKVVAENADEVLWPGQAVEVALTVEVKQRMLSAPASAVLPAQQGMITWVIGPDNKVAPRVVTVERIVGSDRLPERRRCRRRTCRDRRPAAPCAGDGRDHRATPRAPAKAPGEDRRADGRG